MTPFAIATLVLTAEGRAVCHTVPTILHITLKGDVNTIVATLTLVYQCPVEVELLTVEYGVRLAVLYWNIEQILIERLYLQVPMVRELPAKGSHEVMALGESELLVYKFVALCNRRVPVVALICLWGIACEINVGLLRTTMKSVSKCEAYVITQLA